MELGLADGIGSIYDIIERKYGKKAKIKLIDQKKSFFQKRFSNQLIDTDSLLQKIEEKSMWSRFGL